MVWKNSWLVVLLLLLAGSNAGAHFLFVRITPPAEAGRAAEVYFSELAEAGDPQFIDKIAHTKLWVQTAPGKFEPVLVLKGADRLRAPLPGGSLAVVGACEYGVIERKTPFLLRHFPKAIAGKPEDLNRLEATDKVPLEIVARITNAGVKLVALHQGKPLAGAIFHTVARDLTGDKLKAGADGSVLWKPPAPGAYSVYTSLVSKKAGEAKGKKYTEVRDFATLAFTWPLAAGPDPAAVTLFQEALAARAHWKGFPGFSAHASGTVEGRPFSGSVTVSATGAVSTDIQDETGQSWMQEQLDSTVLHRGAGNSARASGQEKPILYFADADKDHPLGRLLIFEGGRFASSYRVKDKQILVVNRRLGKENMTILVLENERTPAGTFLPRSYTVQYWDAATGKLKRTEAIRESWQRVGSWELPAGHTIAVASDTGLAVRSFTLSKFQLLR